jgi:polysaccharide deacetylase family protein (PEP-CTERM system associated)
MSLILNALTIDVEEHFQVHAFETVIDRSTWDRQSSRVVANTHRILRLLAEYNVRATFFVLGWVADRYPDLVKKIAASGHEIATHGYWHELVYRQTPEEFAADLSRSLDAIGRAYNGLQPAGYRAPAFSITEQSLWALDVLRDHNIIYDSSIFPLVAHDRYGISNASRFANKMRRDLWEFPVSTVRLGKQNWPVAGGGYFRLFPLWVTRQAIRHLNKQGHPAVIYLHPWEFDPDQPRIRDAPLLSRFRHYVNIDKTESRLRALLNEFEFAPVCDVFASLLETA